MKTITRDPWWTVLLVALLFLPSDVASFLVPTYSSKQHRLRQQLTRISMRQQESQVDTDYNAPSSLIISQTQDEQAVSPCSEDDVKEQQQQGGVKDEVDVAVLASDDSSLVEKQLQEGLVVNKDLSDTGTNSPDGLWNFLVTLKEALYARIYQILSDLITIIKRSTQKTEAWIREDTVGQLVSSALALIAFYAAVAAFAVWNINLLNGNKQSWSIPTEVTVPTVRLPSSQSTAPSGITFQKPKWQAPKITTSYSASTNQDGKGKEREEERLE